LAEGRGLTLWDSFLILNRSVAGAGFGSFENFCGIIHLAESLQVFKEHSEKLFSGDPP